MNAMPAPTRPDPPPFADAFDALPHEHDDVSDEAAEDTAPARRPAPPDAAEGQLVAWLAAVGEHDERALAALYDATLPRLYGLVLRIVRRPALADEVVEDTYFQVWRQALRFDATRGRVMTWLLGMARSRAIDALRREARFVHESLDADDGPETPDEAPPADALLDAARGRADLERALLKLQPQPRQLVAMAFFGGLSHEEIAAQMALPLGTVKSQIRRALLALRQWLGDAGAPA